jgi:hypothetical protein
MHSVWFKGWQVDETVAQPESARAGVEWFNNQLNKAMSRPMMIRKVSYF